MSGYRAKQNGSVEFYGSKVSGVGMEHLKGLTKLHALNFGRTRVNDAGLEHLKELTRLEQLYLFDTKVTAAGVAKLQQALPNCKITR